MSEENKNLKKNNEYQIINAIVEVTLLTMEAFLGEQQNLCNLMYRTWRDKKLLEFDVSTKHPHIQWYTCNGTISISKDEKEIDFIAEVKIDNIPVSRIHIGFDNNLKVTNDVELAVDGYKRCNFKLVNGQMEIINNVEDTQKYEDDSVALENDKDAQVFTK